jgi:hypothetical protein
MLFVSSTEEAEVTVKSLDGNPHEDRDVVTFQQFSA